MITKILFFTLVLLLPFPQDAQVKDNPKAVGEATDKKKPEASDLTELKSLDEMKEMISKEWDLLLKTFESEGIKVDLDKKTVEVKGAIIRDVVARRYPIEYVVVSEGGHTHEAMILIKAKPSNLNAALMSLGLNPGKTISSKKKDPPPSKEDIESGKTSAYELIPPQGQVVYIYVRYDGWKDSPLRLLEDLIIDYRTGESMQRVGWVYVGSRFATVLQGRQRVVKYMADMEGNVVASYLKGFGNAIFDINSIDGIKDHLFDVNPDLAPPMKSKISLVFSLKPLQG